jgi:membrane protease YdiL (CAAX protease family)
VLPTASDLWSQVPRTGRGARLAQCAPVRVTIGFFFLAPGAALETLGAMKTSGWLRGAAACLAVVVYVASLHGFARWVEKRRPLELSTGRGALEWVIGLALGAALLSATLGTLVALGGYRVDATGTLDALVTGLRVHVPHALLEELLFRALLFKIAEESLGSGAALVIEASLFGALHLANPGATAIGAVAIALEAGVLLTAAYLCTRRIWLAWGLHVGWNVTQSSLFGIKVSGLPPGPSVFSSKPLGPDWLTGGAFGVEASPIAVALCLLVAVALMVAAVRRGQWVA